MFNRCERQTLKEAHFSCAKSALAENLDRGCPQPQQRGHPRTHRIPAIDRARLASPARTSVRAAAASHNNAIASDPRAVFLHQLSTPRPP